MNAELEGARQALVTVGGVSTADADDIIQAGLDACAYVDQLNANGSAIALGGSDRDAVASEQPAVPAARRITMAPDLVKRLRNARAVGTPIIALETSEPGAASRAICDAVNGTAPCKLVWDCIRGTVPANDPSATVLTAVAEAMGISAPTIDELAQAFADPINALLLVQRLPGESLVILHNTHRLLAGEPARTLPIVQAIWNLRDVLKANGSTVVLLAPTHILPTELSQDVTLLKEPMPSDADIAETICSVYESCEITAPTDAQIAPMTVALRGLNLFAAEQATAESMKATGVDLAALWDRKKAVIEQTKGASFQTHGLVYHDLGGLSAIKSYFDGLFDGPRAPSVIVMFDEFEKQMAGSDAQGDNGVGRDMLQVILREMVEQDYAGGLFAGHPGTGKSAFTEALAITHGVPIIKADLNAVKGSLLGESEQGIRDFFRMIRGVVGGAKGAALFIGCCNKLTEQIPPELRRRFTRRGVWMFDLPTPEERESIWKIALRRYGRPYDPGMAFPDDSNWTGADIVNCVDIADALRVPLSRAASYLVPVAVSDPESIAALRKAAHNRWLSVTSDGPFQIPQPSAVAATAALSSIASTPSGGRRMKVGE